MKVLADDKFDVAKMLISLFDRVDDIMGKGENAGAGTQHLTTSSFLSNFILSSANTFNLYQSQIVVR